MDVPIQMTNRPVQVSRAITLLWLALILGLLSAISVYLEPMPPESEVPAWSLWLLLALVTVFWALLTYLISRGHNWARITTLILTIASVVGHVTTLADSQTRGLLSPYIIVTDILLTLITLLAMYWLFTGHGAAWFRQLRS